MMICCIIKLFRPRRAAMNYRVLAISVVIGVGVIAAGLMEAQRRASTPVAERVTSTDIAEPENEFGFMEAQNYSPLPTYRSEPEEPAPPPPKPDRAVSV